MAVELHVMFAGKLPTKAALTRAMKELGFPVSIPAGGVRWKSRVASCR